MKFNYKQCIACGCLTAIIVTDWGIFCKKCFDEMHKHSDLPTSSYFSENLEAESDMIYNISRSAIENTTTIGTMDFDGL